MDAIGSAKGLDTVAFFNHEKEKLWCPDSACSRASFSASSSIVRGKCTGFMFSPHPELSLNRGPLVKPPETLPPFEKVKDGLS